MIEHFLRIKHQYWRVRLFRNILFTLAAMLWLPASAHCQLENLTGLTIFACQDSDNCSHGPCSDDGCSVEKSHYLFKSAHLTPPLLSTLMILLPQLTAPSPASNSFAQISTAPPEFSPRWQFLLRTAPSPRAPSVA